MAILEAMRRADLDSADSPTTVDADARLHLRSPFEGAMTPASSLGGFGGQHSQGSRTPTTPGSPCETLLDPTPNHAPNNMLFEPLSLPKSVSVAQTFFKASAWPQRRLRSVAKGRADRGGGSTIIIHASFGSRVV